jgi:preprotein translocase SecE subunit
MAAGREVSSRTDASRSGSGKGFSVGAARSFMSESVDELKKIAHPTRQETIQATIIALVFMGFFAIVLALLDWVLRGLVWTVV